MSGGRMEGMEEMRREEKEREEKRRWGDEEEEEVWTGITHRKNLRCGADYIRNRGGHQRSRITLAG